MSTTLSMWFGFLFLLLGIVAVLLQAWLWNPKYWDEETKKTHAPAFWLRVHRVVGYTFFVLYVVMMWHMVPRLWEYQVELPARTVVHATSAIILGVLLITKISILRWFRHFEEAMPRLGFGVLVCTVVIGSLSLPFAARGHGFGAPDLDGPARDRLTRILASVDALDGTDAADLTTSDSLSRGREVLVTQCVRCHDMRTILARPRTGNGWFKVIDRMTEKPSVFGQPIVPDDVPYVTAYMVSITPKIQESAKDRRQAERQRGNVLRELVGGVFGTTGTPTEPTPADAPEATPPATEGTGGETGPGATGTGTGGPAPVEPTPPVPPAVDMSVDEGAAQALLEAKCTECHELDDVDGHGGDDVDGWAEIVREMVDEGAEIEDAEARVLVKYLAQTRPKK